MEIRIEGLGRSGDSIDIFCADPKERARQIDDLEAAFGDMLSPSVGPPIKPYSWTFDEADFRRWADCGAQGFPKTAWGTHTAAMSLVRDWPLAPCADHVIRRMWLGEGDARPLAALFRLGLAPASWVLAYVGARAGQGEESSRGSHQRRLQISKV